MIHQFTFGSERTTIFGWLFACFTYYLYAAESKSEDVKIIY